MILLSNPESDCTASQGPSIDQEVRQLEHRHYDNNEPWIRAVLKYDRAVVFIDTDDSSRIEEQIGDLVQTAECRTKLKLGSFINSFQRSCLSARFRKTRLVRL